MMHLKIALCANDDKRIQSIDSVETQAYVKNDINNIQKKGLNVTI